jgi:5-methylcytosine-specific restriction endonuclease McrA
MKKPRKKKRRSCVYCGSTHKITIDHVVPISQWRKFGVKRRVLDNKSNKVLACLKCNAEKGSMSPQEWFALHPEYKERFIRETRYLSNPIKKIIGLL